jgi:hypothetical protein
MKSGNALASESVSVPRSKKRKGRWIAVVLLAKKRA